MSSSLGCLRVIDSDVLFVWMWPVCPAMLSSLFHFLLEVSSHSSVNKMSPDNLAIVFAPNLIRPKVETPTSMMSEMPSSISVIASLIGHYDEIFAVGGSSSNSSGSAAPSGP
jgi:hypothetical protein